MMDWKSFAGVVFWAVVYLSVAVLLQGYHLLTILGLIIATIGFVVWAMYDTKRCLE